MTHIFGPVPSRRLGRVLGIDLIPHKTCTFDCLYCDLGSTTLKTVKRERFYPPEAVLSECETRLKLKDQSVDYLSICGSGEPTLYQGLGKIVRGLKDLTDIPLALVTNGALLGRGDVQEAVAGVDVVLPSLDAVSKPVFSALNRPHSSLSLKKIISGLKAFRGGYGGQIWLEICLCRCINDDPGELEKYREIIRKISPDRVQLNTPVRAPAEDYAVPLTSVHMEKAKKILGEGVEIISAYHGPVRTRDSLINEPILLEMLKRHPATRRELKDFFPSLAQEIDDVLSQLVTTGRICYLKHGGELYYRAKS